MALIVKIASGECPNMPCDKLKNLFNDPEHGDSGVRLKNLKDWVNGQNTYNELR